MRKVEVDLDEGRGVLYLHSRKDGYTILRVCGLHHLTSDQATHNLTMADVTICKGEGGKLEVVGGISGAS